MKYSQEVRALVPELRRLYCADVERVATQMETRDGVTREGVDALIELFGMAPELPMEMLAVVHAGAHTALRVLERDAAGDEKPERESQPQPVGVLDQAARACHELIVLWCRLNGDDSQVPWEKAPEWQRKSAYSMVLAIWADPTMTGQRTHDEWVEDKLAAKWVWGAEKDAEFKTHPCIVPYGELPAWQRAKDDIVLAAARSFRPADWGTAT